MVEEIKTMEQRKDKLIKLGKNQGYITYEQLASELKGLEIDSDSLDDLYNSLVSLGIDIVSEDVVMMQVVMRLLNILRLKI